MKTFQFKAFLSSLLFLVSIGMYAQSVSGTVSSEDGPLPGATVVVKGTNNGTTTDFDGNFTISAESDAVLVVSFVGFATQEVAVSGQDQVAVMLLADNELEEVVLTGYGSTKIKDATGSVAAVTAADFNRGVIASPEQLIQGKTAGVQISQTSGEPGAGVQIRIRGTNSVRSNNNPLFVVDGVPLSGGDTSANGQDIGFGTSDSRNPLNFLNPNDIASISILKDASAAAIYGSRGANGVVIISTRNGASGGDGSFEFSSTLSAANPSNTYDLLGAADFLRGVTQFGGNATTQNFGSETDWQDVIFRTAISQNQNFSYAKNSNGSNFRATMSYGKQNGVVENSSMERLTLRLNWNKKLLNDKLTLNAQASYSDIIDEAAPTSGSAGFRGDILGATFTANPTWPNDPDFNNTGGLANPANWLRDIFSETNTTRTLFNLTANYALNDNITAKVTYGIDASSSTRKSAVGKTVVGVDNGSIGNGRASVNDIDLMSNLFEFTLDYNKELGNSNLDVLLGYAYQDFGSQGRNASGWGFTTDSITAMANVTESSADNIEAAITGSFQNYGIGTNGSFVNRLDPATTDTVNLALSGVRAVSADTYDNTDYLQSFFGRVNYSIQDKYLITATVRADGSSRFGPDNQYGIFPSGAVAWKMNEEDFVPESFSTLKLRVGAGVTGSQDGIGYGNFVRRERYGFPGIANDGVINPPGLGVQSFVNNALKWEETTSYNVGIDFGLNNDRLTGSIEYYNKTTNDLLLSVPAAQPSPQAFFFTNLDASVVNNGYELSLNYDIIQGTDLNWSASFNISKNTNELQDFGGQIPAGTVRGPGLSQAYAQILAGGQPLFSYFVREFEGFDSTGQPIGDNQTFIGEDALPDVNTGLSMNVSYKNWDFSAYGYGQYGFSVYNNTKNAFFVAGSIKNARNVTPDVLTSGEAGTAEAAVSSRFLEKGDFFRLQNVSVGYNFPLADGGTFDSLRLSLTGQNLFLITDYSGLDPEVSVNSAGYELLNGLPTAGMDWTAYPRPRTFTLGLNARF